MTQKLRFYCQKFSPIAKKINPIGLNVSTNTGIALNKPILLLSIIEMISKGQITKNEIYFTPELIATFLKLWSYLEHVRKPNIGLPFYHLTSDGFWHYKMKQGFEGLKKAEIRIRTPNTIRATVEYGFFDDDLWKLLINAESRAVLTQVLVDSWFSGADNIDTLMHINAFAEKQELLYLDGGKTYDRSIIKNEEENIVRDAAFRRIIVNAYDYRCAFCGLRLIDIKGQNTVDGAHIMPFAKFYDDRIVNGLSLCKNHHWAFDKGWFSINDDYTIVVSENLQEEAPNCTPMKKFAGKEITLPVQQQYHPCMKSLRWHRENMFDAA